MKRWAWVLVAAGLLLGPVTAAQVAPGSRARVRPVLARGEAARFQVPQVQLPNAAVARRINARLLQVVTAYSGIDSTASPQRQLYLAARRCCYDEEVKSWLAGGDGLTELSYTVLLNQDYLLSVEFVRSYQGLEDPATTHLTFDLRTGNVLTLADLLADPPLRMHRRLRAAVSRRLRDKLGQVVAQYGDSATVAHVAELYGLFNWNATPGRGRAEDMAFPDDSPQPLEFALTPTEVLLFHPVGMSRLEFEFLPDEAYFFPYERVRPAALLAPVAQKAKIPVRTDTE